MYKIIISQKAKADIRDYTLYLRRISQNAVIAKNWSQQLYALIKKLDEMPMRYAVIPESEKAVRELRHFIYHSHRVVYGVDEQQKTVTIYRVYHGARQPL